VLVFPSSVFPFFLEGSLPSPFIEARGEQGYMHCCVMFFPVRKSRSLRSCPVVGGVSLLKEWPLCFDVVAMCSDIRSSMDDAAMTCRIVSSLWRRARPCGLTVVESRGLGGMNHGVISPHSRE
jgi:hypothetical protein